MTLIQIQIFFLSSNSDVQSAEISIKAIYIYLDLPEFSIIRGSFSYKSKSLWFLYICDIPMGMILRTACFVHAWIYLFHL